MTEPPTMVIWDADEERTVVDQARLAGPDPAFEGSGDATPPKAPSVPGERPKPQTQPRWQSASALLSCYKRYIIEIGVAFTVLFGLGSVAYQQWQVAEALLETLAEMRAPRQAMVAVHPGELPRTLETPARDEMQRKAFVREISADQREELERQAADLIASNDFPAALSQYETLAGLFPGDRTFRDFITVLRAKLRCDRSSQSEGNACR